MNDKIEYIKQDLMKYLSESRYDHSLRVANEAKKLAIHYHIDENKAYIAGLVHDIAKEFSDEKNKELILKYNLSKKLLFPQFKNIIHADIGAVIAKEIYGLDNNICTAILYHTIGNINMNTLDKIIFIADKIGRKVSNPTIEKLKILAYINLDQALIFYLTNLKEKFESNGKKLHQNSLKLLDLL